MSDSSNYDIIRMFCNQLLDRDFIGTERLTLSADMYSYVMDQISHFKTQYIGVGDT